MLSPEEFRELYPILTPLERANLDKILKLPRTWEPQAGPQTLAFQSPADITGYGGQAGGGKTDLLVGLAHREHQRTIIFRREFAQMTGIEERCGEVYLPLGGKYNGQKHVWRLPNDRRVELGAVSMLGDEKKYQGRPHDLKCFDEVTEFAEQQVRFLMGWMRSARGKRCRAVMTFNPPTTAEGRWVISYFGPWLDDKHPNPAMPGELRWYISDKDGNDQEVPDSSPVEVNGKMIQPMSRTFIPAKLDDNAFLRDTGYRSVLQSLPEPLRSQMLYGDFKAGIADDAMQLIPTAWVEAAMARWTEKKPYVVRTAIGADIARGGRDKTVFTSRYGHWYDRQISIPGIATPDGNKVVEKLIEHKLTDAPIHMDVIGVGTSPVDIGKMYKLNIIPMHAAEGSEAFDRSGKLGFVNKRAEWFWKFRESLDPVLGDNIALPPDPELKADLCAPHWELMPRGIKVESKDNIIDRIHRSPDKGDSLIYASARAQTAMNISKRMLEISARG